MANVELSSLQVKTTPDLIKQTSEALNLSNNNEVKQLLRQMNLGDNTNDFVRMIVLEFLEQVKKSCISGYKVSLINFQTLYPDFIFHTDKDQETAIVTLKSAISTRLLQEMRNSTVKFKEEKLVPTEMQEVNLW